MDAYQSPKTGGTTPKLPSLDPTAHSARLLKQLAAIYLHVQARAETARDDLASREIIAVRPAAGSQLTPDQLDDTRADARLIGTVPETGTVLLDVANSDLEYVRKKFDAYADDGRVTTTEQAGVTTTHRDKERAVAPIENIALAELEDVGGARLRAAALVADRAYWFEIACRGGYRRPLLETEESRTQVSRQLRRIHAEQQLDEFVGPEQVYFFVRLAQHQLDALRAATDCIYEVDLAAPPLRDLKLLEDITTKDVKNFSLLHLTRTRQARDSQAPALAACDRKTEPRRAR